MRLARFWAGVLEWDIFDETHEEIGVLPTDGTRFILVFLPVPEPKVSKNRLHLDLVSDSAEHQAQMVDRFIGLGARRIDIGQGDVPWVVLADPEDNEFCVVLRGEFFATAGLIGAIVFEPADPAVGRFWGEAIGWPVVYDQDGDIAILAPDGRGPFITFGPPGGAKKTAKGRIHLDIAPTVGGDLSAEVERLVLLGARRIDIGQGDVPWVVLADPEDNEFCVFEPGSGHAVPDPTGSQAAAVTPS